MAHAGKSVSAPVNARLLTTLQGMLSSEEDVVRTYAAKTLGIVSLVSSPTYHTTSFLFQILRHSPSASLNRLRKYELLPAKYDAESSICY